MYCCVWCLKRDKNEVHRALCGSSNVSHLEEDFAQRFQGRTLASFKDSMDELNENLKESAPLYSVFDFDLSNCRNTAFCKNMLLASMDKEVSSEYYRAQEFRRKFMPNVVMKDFDFDFAVPLSHRLSFSRDFLFPSTIWSVSKINEESEWGKYYFNEFISTIGWSFHPLTLVFNTSCHCNLHVVNFTGQGVSAWIVKYPVKAGDQLFLHYLNGNDWYSKDKVKRQPHWMKTYNFNCECEACVNDWNVAELRDYSSIHPSIPKTLPKSEEAFKKFKENGNYINKRYKRDYPIGEFEIC
jgi:hypothetical protein